MKTLLTTALLAFAATAFAAEPVLYQANISDLSGKAAASETVSLNISVNDAEGNEMASESLSATTDARGHLCVEVGRDKTVEWADAASLSVKITRADGSEISDTATLSAAPTALYAASASGLVSNVSDSQRYVLAVDDNGKLSAQPEKVYDIAIPEGYSTMVFHDEFDYEGLPDSRYWGYEVGNVRNGEDQYYTDARLENVNVYDGIAHFTVREDEAYLRSIGENEKRFTSASIQSRNKVKFLYGRIDVRAKLSDVRGTWPAIWLMPNDDHYGFWPRSGEIDIMEQVGFDPDVVHFTAHTSKYNGGAPANKHHYSVRVPTNDTEFHVYSLVWTPDKLQWLVDDKVRYTFKKNSPNWLDWPFDRDFYIILNLAWGGGWGGQQGIDEAALPAHYEVDYVRVFQ